MEAPAYVKWKEAFVLSEKGTKEVRYYLKRKDGSLDLAVVGTMKHSLVPLPYRYNVCNKALLKKGSFVLNLKSRIQVVHWLDSIVLGTFLDFFNLFLVFLMCICVIFDFDCSCGVKIVFLGFLVC